MLNIKNFLIKRFLTALYDKRLTTIKKLKDELYLIDRDMKIKNRNKIIYSRSVSEVAVLIFYDLEGDIKIVIKKMIRLAPKQVTKVKNQPCPRKTGSRTRFITTAAKGKDRRSPNYTSDESRGD